MPTPNLKHPVPVMLQQLGFAETFQDDDYREPVQQAAYGATLTISGQISWTMKEALTVHIGGVSYDASGYVLFRYTDLNTSGIVLKINDRFIKLGTIETDSYIVKIQPMGHYTSAGGPTLLKAFFADRGPARQRLDL